MKQFYNPQPDDKGYFYHVEIYHEALLNYEQHLQKTHGERPCKGDPDDNTDYSAVDWYKDGSTSFAKKEWNDLITDLRNHFKRSAGLMLQLEGDWKKRHIYHVGNVIGLEGKFLLRDHVWIYHSSTINFDDQQFASDLTRIGRWEK